MRGLGPDISLVGITLAVPISLCGKSELCKYSNALSNNALNHTNKLLQLVSFMPSSSTTSNPLLHEGLPLHVAATSRKLATQSGTAVAVSQLEFAGHFSNLDYDASARGRLFPMSWGRNTFCLVSHQGQTTVAVPIQRNSGLHGLLTSSPRQGGASSEMLLP